MLMRQRSLRALCPRQVLVSAGPTRRGRHRGEALSTALRLAESLASLPDACMRSDRRSVYEQWGMPLADAIRRGTELGLDVIRRTSLAGLHRWTRGEGNRSEFADV